MAEPDPPRIDIQPEHAPELQADPYQDVLSGLEQTVATGQDAAPQAKFLIHLIGNFVDPGLKGAARKKAIEAATQPIYGQMSPDVRMAFSNATGLSFEEPAEDSGQAAPAEQPEEHPAGEVNTAPPDPEAGFNGSTITIVNSEAITAALQRDHGWLELSRETNFGKNIPIEKIESFAQSIANDKEHLRLFSRVNMSGDTWDEVGSRNRFRNFLPRWRNRQDGAEGVEYLIRDGLLVQPTEYNNAWLVTDESGVSLKVVVLTHEGKCHIEVKNFKQGDEKQAVPQVSLSETDAVEQLKSLGRVTAMVADLCSTFNINVGGENVDDQTKQQRRKQILEGGLRQEYIFRAGLTSKIESELSTFETNLAHESDAIRLDDIAGYESVKKELLSIAAAFANPEVMRKWAADRPRGILLFGPPGTGKTTLAKGLATELGADYREYEGSDIFEKWTGSSGRNLKAIFEELEAVERPTLVFLDEFESFINKSKYDDTRKEIAGAFKRGLTKLYERNPNILLVAATNFIDDIDPSIIRPGRIDLKVEVPLPNEYDRAQILTLIVQRSNVRGTNVFESGIVPVDLAAATEDLSGADLVAIANRLKNARAMAEINHEPTKPISQQELMQAIEDYKSSLDSDE